MQISIHGIQVKLPNKRHAVPQFIGVVRVTSFITLHNVLYFP